MNSRNSTTSASLTAAAESQPGGSGHRQRRPFQIVEIDLARVFADSAAGTLKAANTDERVCGTIPADMGAAGGIVQALQASTGAYEGPHGMTTIHYLGLQASGFLDCRLAIWW
jgi:hypothetical protein